MDLEFKIEVQHQDIYQTTSEKLAYKITVKGVSPAHINTFIDELFACMDKVLPGTVTIEENNDFVSNQQYAFSERIKRENHRSLRSEIASYFQENIKRIKRENYRSLRSEIASYFQENIKRIKRENYRSLRSEIASYLGDNTKKTRGKNEQKT